MKIPSPVLSGQVLSSTNTGTSWADISDIIGVAWVLGDDSAANYNNISIGDTANFIGGLGIGTSVSGGDTLNIYGTYTASNGLTLDSEDFKLGGTLTALTKIDQDGNDFGFLAPATSESARLSLHISWRSTALWESALLPHSALM